MPSSPPLSSHQFFAESKSNSSNYNADRHNFFQAASELADALGVYDDLRDLVRKNRPLLEEVISVELINPWAIPTSSNPFSVIQGLAIIHLLTPKLAQHQVFDLSVAESKASEELGARLSSHVEPFVQNVNNLLSSYKQQFDGFSQLFESLDDNHLMNQLVKRVNTEVGDCLMKFGSVQTHLQNMVEGEIFKVGAKLFETAQAGISGVMDGINAFSHFSQKELPAVMSTLFKSAQSHVEGFLQQAQSLEFLRDGLSQLLNLPETAQNLINIAKQHLAIDEAMKTMDLQHALFQEGLVKVGQNINLAAGLVGHLVSPICAHIISGVGNAIVGVANHIGDVVSNLSKVGENIVGVASTFLTGLINPLAGIASLGAGLLSFFGLGGGSKSEDIAIMKEEILKAVQGVGKMVEDLGKYVDQRFNRVEDILGVIHQDMHSGFQQLQEILMASHQGIIRQLIQLSQQQESLTVMSSHLQHQVNEVLQRLSTGFKILNLETFTAAKRALILKQKQVDLVSKNVKKRRKKQTLQGQQKQEVTIHFDTSKLESLIETFSGTAQDVAKSSVWAGTSLKAAQQDLLAGFISKEGVEAHINTFRDYAAQFGVQCHSPRPNQQLVNPLLWSEATLCLLELGYFQPEESETSLLLVGLTDIRESGFELRDFIMALRTNQTLWAGLVDGYRIALLQVLEVVHRMAKDTFEQESDESSSQGTFFERMHETVSDGIAYDLQQLAEQTESKRISFLYSQDVANLKNNRAELKQLGKNLEEMETFTEVIGQTVAVQTAEKLSVSPLIFSTWWQCHTLATERHKLQIALQKAASDQGSDLYKAIENLELQYQWLNGFLSLAFRHEYMTNDTLRRMVVPNGHLWSKSTIQTVLASAVPQVSGSDMYLQLYQESLLSLEHLQTWLREQVIINEKEQAAGHQNSHYPLLDHVLDCIDKYCSLMHPVEQNSDSEEEIEPTFHYQNQPPSAEEKLPEASFSEEASEFNPRLFPRRLPPSFRHEMRPVTASAQGEKLSLEVWLPEGFNSPLALAQLLSRQPMIESLVTGPCRNNEMGMNTPPAEEKREEKPIAITSVIVLEEGQYIATCTRDSNTIELYGLAGENTYPLAQLSGHSAGVLNLIVLGSRRFASISLDRTIKIWNLSAQGATCITTLNVEPPKMEAKAAAAKGPSTGKKEAEPTEIKPDIFDGKLAALGDGRLASSFSNEKNIRIWALKLRSGECVVTLTAKEKVTALAALGQNRLASGDQEGEIQIWILEPKSAKCIATLQAYSVPYLSTLVSWFFGNKPAVVKKVTVLVALKDGRLVSSSFDGTIRIWVEGKCVIFFKEESAILALADLDNGYLASSSNTSIKLWSLTPELFIAGDLRNSLLAKSKTVSHKFNLSDVTETYELDFSNKAYIGFGQQCIKYGTISHTVQPLELLEPLKLEPTADFNYSAAALTALSDGRLVSYSPAQGIKLWTLLGRRGDVHAQVLYKNDSARQSFDLSLLKSILPGACLKVVPESRSQLYLQLPPEQRDVAPEKRAAGLKLLVEFIRSACDLRENQIVIEPATRQVHFKELDGTHYQWVTTMLRALIKQQEPENLSLAELRKPSYPDIYGQRFYGALFRLPAPKIDNKKKDHNPSSSEPKTNHTSSSSSSSSSASSSGKQ